MKLIRNLLERIETARASLARWCAAFLGILFVRFLLETFSSPTPSFPAAPSAASLIQYILFFFGAFLSIALVLRIFVPDIARVSKFLIFGFPIVWLAPIIDLAYSHGAGAIMTYVFAANGSSIIYAFLHIGASGPLGGLTGGLSTEIMAIFIGAGLYILVKTGNIMKAVLAGFLTYCALFLWGIAPSILAIIAAGHTFTQSSVFAYLTSTFLSSHLLANFVRPSAHLSPLLATETAFNVGMSAVLYIVVLALAALWGALYDRAAAAAFVKSLRYGRMAYYYSLMAMGAFVAIFMGSLPAFANWADIILFACLALAYFSSFIFAMGVNDVADVSIDRLNGSTRPLAANIISEEKVKSVNMFFLVWALVGGFICGYWALFTIMVFIAAYYIYSVPPVRFKRVPLISSFLVSVAGLSVTMAGFFFVDARKVIADFPLQLGLLIVICLTLAVNFKDIKDIDGDRAHDIWTIPVLLGKERGKQAVGTLLAASFLAVPVILGNPSLFFVSLVAAVLGYAFVTTRSYREWRVFVLYFAYLGVVGWMLTH